MLVGPPTVQAGFDLHVPHISFLISAELLTFSLTKHHLNGWLQGKAFSLLFHMPVLELENIILVLYYICVGHYFSLSQYAVLKTEE